MGATELAQRFGLSSRQTIYDRATPGELVGFDIAGKQRFPLAQFDERVDGCCPVSRGCWPCSARSGDGHAAWQWLSRPNSALDGRAPLQLLRENAFGHVAGGGPAAASAELDGTYRRTPRAMTPGGWHDPFDKRRPASCGAAFRSHSRTCRAAPARERTASRRPAPPTVWCTHASTVGTAVCETLLRDRFGRGAARGLGLWEIEARPIVRLSAASRRFALLELRGRGPLRIGAPSAGTGDRRLGAGQALGAALHALVPGADGIIYSSHLTGAACVTFPESAAALLKVLTVESLLTRPEPLPALEGFEISIV